MLYKDDFKNSLNSILATTDSDSSNDTTTNLETYTPKIDNNNIDTTTNCLALTVRENYHMVVVKNAFKKSFRISWKVALSIFVINFLNMFL